jgi:protein SCO1/2
MSNPLSSLLIAVGVLVTCCGAQAQDGTAGSMHHHDHHAVMNTNLKRSEVNVKVPVVVQVRQDGKKSGFPGEVDDGRPVILQFIYTSCTTVCPVTTQTFSQVQDLLGKDQTKFHMISVSIDPEYDNARRLEAFSKKIGADAQWHFYTGTLEASVAIQKAFDVYRGDKMNHVPVTFLRAAPGKSWVRLDGLREPADIVKEFRLAVGQV